jgi:hypothetical protein
MTTGNFVLICFPLAVSIYAGFIFLKDFNFYKKNNFDFTKESGVPDFWVNVAWYRFVLTPKQRFMYGYPAFAILLIGLTMLFSIVKFK